MEGRWEEKNLSCKYHAWTHADAGAYARHKHDDDDDDDDDDDEHAQIASKMRLPE